MGHIRFFKYILLGITCFTASIFFFFFTMFPHAKCQVINRIRRAENLQYRIGVYQTTNVVDDIVMCSAIRYL